MIKMSDLIFHDIDFFLIDIKDMNPDIYQKYTGRKNDHTLNNLRLLAKEGMAGKTKIRIPLIPDFNSDPDRERSVEVCREMGFENFDLFNYEVERALEKRRH